MFFIFPKTCLADSSDIFINELMWQEGASKSIADEWLELYNSSDDIVDISGYYLTDETSIGADGKPKILIKLCDKRADKCADSQYQIAPHETFLISNGGKESYLDVEPDIVDSHLVLNNPKLQIGLYDKAGNELDIFGGTDTNDDNLNDDFAPYKHDCLTNPKDGATPENPGTYCSLQRLNTFSPGDSPDSWESSSEEMILDSLIFPDGEKIFATPTPSGRPQISNFVLADQSYELGSSKSFHFSYSQADSGGDFSGVDVIANSGAQTLTQNLLAAQIDFSLPASSQCWDLVFSFTDSKQLTYNKHIPLKCYSTNSRIVFSEILSAPKDIDWDGNGTSNSQDEWFELANLSGSDYELQNWKVQDASGKAAPISGNILANGFLVFYHKDTKISLNNSGETLYLYDPGGKLIDQIKIPALGYNISYSKFDDGWKLTKTATPSLENIFLTTEKPALKNTEPISRPSVDVAIKLAVAESLPIEVIAETPIVEETIVVTEYTTKISSPPLQLPDIELASISLPEVKGSKTGPMFYPSDLSRLLLYSFSALIFVLLVFLYEFYRRE